MSLLLGSIIRSPIRPSQPLTLSILKQLKHYLTLQTTVTVEQTEFYIKLISRRKLSSSRNDSTQSNQFYLPKSLSHLWTHWQKIIIQDEQDLQFFDVCYQCLMTMKENLPTKISIGVEILENYRSETQLNENLSLNEFLQNFQQEKQQEFSRRVNSNFKSLVSNTYDVTSEQIQNILYLSQHFYFYKNKLAAIKFLAANDKISHQYLAQVNEKYLDFLKELSRDEDFGEFCEKIIEKIMIAKQVIRNQESLQQYQNQDNFQNDKENSDEQNDFQNNRNELSINPKPSYLGSAKQNHPNTQTYPKPHFNHHQQPKKPLQLKPNNSNIKIIEFDSETNVKQPQKHNFTLKSLLFQLRQSTSLKRLSMVIRCVAQAKTHDEKYEGKIDRQIENVCKKFIKQHYPVRIELENSRKTGQEVKKAFLKENSKNMTNQVHQMNCSNEEKFQELKEFYTSLDLYFKRNNPKVQAKSSKTNAKQSSLPKKGQKQKFKQTDMKKTAKQNINFQQLLQMVCQTIEATYYGKDQRH